MVVRPLTSGAMRTEKQHLPGARIEAPIASCALGDARRATMLLLAIILIILIFGFGYGGYRAGPGWGYYGGGSVSLILLIVLILLLARII
jgi:hypothetical protein